MAYFKWKAEVEDAILHKVMRAYWQVFWNLNGYNAYRDKQLLLLKWNIKKRLPTWVISPKVWFFGVTIKKVRFNPLCYNEIERFFEQLLIWNRQKLTKFLEKNPELLRK